MGYVIGILVHHVVWVSLVLSLDRGLHTTRQRGMIRSSGMFFDMLSSDNGVRCARVPCLARCRTVSGLGVTFM